MSSAYRPPSAHCPVCHEAIEAVGATHCAVPEGYDPPGGVENVDYARCQCGTKTGATIDPRVPICAPTAAPNELCCPICGRSCKESALIVSYRVHGGREVNFRGEPKEDEKPVDVSFQCGCGAAVEVDGMNRADDRLEIFGRAMTYREFNTETGKRQVFAYIGRGFDVYIRSDNNEAPWHYQIPGNESDANFPAKEDARDACEKYLRETAERIMRLASGGLVGL